YDPVARNDHATDIENATDGPCDGLLLGAEEDAGQRLQRDRDRQRHDHAMELLANESAQKRVFEDDPEDGRDEYGGNDRHVVVDSESTEQYKNRECTDHVQLTVGEVDHPHDAENQCEA